MLKLKKRMGKKVKVKRVIRIPSSPPLFAFCLFLNLAFYLYSHFFPLHILISFLVSNPTAPPPLPQKTNSCHFPQPTFSYSKRSIYNFYPLAILFLQNTRKPIRYRHQLIEHPSTGKRNRDLKVGTKGSGCKSVKFEKSFKNKVHKQTSLLMFFHCPQITLLHQLMLIPLPFKPGSNEACRL